MKKLHNILGYVLTATILTVLIAAFFSNVINSKVNAATIKYSSKTIEVQKLLDKLQEDFEEAQIEEKEKEEIYLDSRTKTASLYQTVCAETQVLAQLKFTDTPKDMERERTRLHESAQVARTCVQGF